MTMLSDHRKQEALWKGFQGLTVAVLILAAGLIYISAHLISRQSKSDVKFERLDRGLCNIIASVPKPLPPLLAGFQHDNCPTP